MHADKKKRLFSHRFTQIIQIPNSIHLCLSVFICVHLWLIGILSGICVYLRASAVPIELTPCPPWFKSLPFPVTRTVTLLRTLSHTNPTKNPEAIAPGSWIFAKSGP